MATGRDYNEVNRRVDDFFKNKSQTSDINKTNQRGYKQEEDTNFQWEELEDKWSHILIDYRKCYSELTDEDVKVDPNHFQKTVERISRRRCRSFQEILDEIENW